MTMTLATFRDLLDTYGADFSRWPQERRDDAVALLAQSQPAQSAYNDAAAVDALFAPSQGDVPKGLLEKILAASRKKDTH